MCSYRYSLHCERLSRLECNFNVVVGEEFVAQKKYGTRGRAFKVTNARGQLGHLERVLVELLWPLHKVIHW